MKSERRGSGEVRKLEECYSCQGRELKDNPTTGGISGISSSLRIYIHKTRRLGRRDLRAVENQ